MPPKSLKARLHVFLRWLDQALPSWKTTVAVIYGIVLFATIPILREIATQFLRDVRHPAAETNLILRDCALAAVYIGFLGLDALITALLVGTIAVVIMKIIQEVVRIYRHIRNPRVKSPRRPHPSGTQPPSNITSISDLGPSGGSDTSAA